MDPFHAGYLTAAGRGCILVNPYLWGTIQHRVWMEGFEACSADRAPRPPEPQPEPEFA